MQISLFDASAKGMTGTYSESWTVNYQPVYSCVTAVHPRYQRVHGSTVMQNLLLWMRIRLSTVYYVLALNDMGLYTGGPGFFLVSRNHGRYRN